MAPVWPVRRLKVLQALSQAVIAKRRPGFHRGGCEPVLMEGFLDTLCRGMCSDALVKVKRLP
jgi:hypothetical protein